MIRVTSKTGTEMGATLEPSHLNTTGYVIIQLRLHFGTAAISYNIQEQEPWIHPWLFALFANRLLKTVDLRIRDESSHYRVCIFWAI